MPSSVFTPIPAYMQQMIAQVQAGGSKITDFNTGSTTRTLFEALAAALSYQSSVTDQLNRDGYLDTATGQALDDLASNFQVPRLAAVPATGQVRITRQSSTGALVIPAGWGQLSTVPIPASPGVGVMTTADAVFADGIATVTVDAIAILGGTAGNLGAAVTLIPTNPVNGVSTQDGFQTSGAWSNGVDVESDDSLRARVPLVVQGRVKGTRVAFLAAALSVPGVSAANVLNAGSVLGDSTTVPAGSVDIFYRGSAGLLGAVQSACENASVLNQNVTAYASISLAAPRGAVRCVVAPTVYVNPGTDRDATAASMITTVLGYFAGLGVGQAARYSQVINLLHAIPQVIAVNLPMGDFRVYTDPAHTVGDIAVAADSYLNLTASDLTVTVAYLT